MGYGGTILIPRSPHGEIYDIGEDKKCIQNLVGTSEGMRPLAELRCIK
jgi:hypothetical protein